MPWSETTPMDQKTQFIADYLRQSLSMSELCDLYGISRKTGYKLVERYLKHGPSGLEERSRKPSSSPNHTPEHIVEAIVALRQRHLSCGAKKLLPILEKRHPNWDLPGRSTVCDILSRQGLVPKKRMRRHIGHPGKPSSSILAPNDCWSADFKGQFKTGDGLYCYPLTVTDGFSRYLFACEGLGSTSVAESKPVFADSGPCRHPIPAHAGLAFRSMPAGIPAHAGPVNVEAGNPRYRAPFSEGVRWRNRGYPCGRFERFYVSSLKPV